MGYPWGDESYPTFEKLEFSYNLELMRNIFYYELHRQLEQRKENRENDQYFGSISGMSADNDERYFSIEKGTFIDDNTVDDYAIALVRALNYVLDNDNDLEYFFRDLFSILEDKAVSQYDKQSTDWCVYKNNKELLEHLLKINDDNNDYAKDIEKYQKKLAEFKVRMREELEEKF